MTLMNDYITATKEQRLHRLEGLRRNTSLITHRETDDEQLKNLESQLGLVWKLPQELYHYMEYFDHSFSKDLRP